METQAKEKKQSVVKDLENLNSGSWVLQYNLTNSRGKEGFGGVMIPNYMDPLVRNIRKYVDQSGSVHHGIWIGELKTVFTPATDPEAARKLDFIIGSPDVTVNKNHVNMHKEYFDGKSSNPRFILTNLDYEDIKEIENSDFIDILVGKLSLDFGKNALGIDKLRWIAAKLGVSYRYSKYMNDASKEKLKIRHNLKTYARESLEHAKQISSILDDLDTAKFNYQVKEMLRLGILHSDNGSFNYRENLLSTTYLGLKEYLETNPDFFAKLKEMLISKLDKESKGL